MKKAMIHISGQMPLSVPLQYVPNIPINEKIMKAIPNKLIQPQYKKISISVQEDSNSKDVVDINEGENQDGNKNNKNNKEKPFSSKKILENLKKMKYSYNDPNPENNGHLLTDLLKNEEDDEQDNKNN